MLEMSSSLNEDKPPAPPLRLTSQNQPATPKHQLHQLNQLNHLNQHLNQTLNSTANCCLKTNQLSNQLSNQLLNQYNSQFNNQTKLNHIPVDQKPLPKEPLELKEIESKSQKKITSKHDKQSSKKNKKLELSNDKRDKPVISPPTNFEHIGHVGFNAETGEFFGLPTTWINLLKISNISKIEQQKNPQVNLVIYF